MIRRSAALALAVAVAGMATARAGPDERHGISVFGDLKYGPGFRHFEYVNPDAPKGGHLRLAGIDSFDTLNPFTLKGVAAAGSGLVFDTLMARAMDEPDALYGLVARGVVLPADDGWVEFVLRPEARWHDGAPLTAEDVKFTFDTLTTKGHPTFKLLFGGVSRAEIVAADRVRFTFKPGRHRDLPVHLAGMPVIPKSYFSQTDFELTTMAPPLGSGPYRVADVDPGRSVTYARVEDYWARDLPVNRGRWNFDSLRWDYYRDRGIALEAFFAGEFDFREEFTSVSWVKRYDKPAVRNGLIVKDAVSHEMPVGVQAFFINLRRAKFRDRRVRRALALAFDFDWTNRTLFYGLYKRLNSVYENTVYAAHDAPSDAELAILEPLRDSVPEDVFTAPFASPTTGRRRSVRANLKQAKALLNEAGWRVRVGRLVDRRGDPFTVEFLLAQPSFQRIVLPYVRNLKRLGIRSAVRIADSSTFVNRRNAFDFDLIMERLPQYPTPGEEQRSYFGSESAGQSGSRNIAGVRNPAVDALLDKVTGARSRAELITATRALDRVLMWNYYFIPHWYKPAYHIAYWVKFGRPRTRPRFDLGFIDTWWFDPEKAARVESRESASGP